MSRKLIASSLLISAGLLLGRLMGFVREVSIASIFGVSAEADIAVLMLTIPDVLVSILVAGGLSAALIPEFKELSQNDAFSLFLQISLGMGVVFSILAAVLGLAPGALVGLFAPGMSEQASLSAQRILPGVLWLIPLTVLAGVTTAFLQSHEKFAIPAMGTFIFNTCVVSGLFLVVRESNNLETLVYFIILGGLLRWGSQLLSLRKHVYRSGNFATSMLSKAILHRYWQAVLAIGLVAFYPVISRSFASFSGAGALALVNYSWRLVELPLGLVITVLSVVLFPRLSEMYANKNTIGFDDWLGEGLIWSLVLAAAIAGPVLASPETLVQLAFGWGNTITQDNLSRISQLLQLAILILPCQAITAMAVVALNAQKNTLTPVKISLLGFVLLVPSCFLGQEFFELTGNLMAVVFSYAVVSVLSAAVIYKRNKGVLKVSMLFFSLLTGVISYLLAAGLLHLSSLPQIFHQSSIIRNSFLIGIAMALPTFFVGFVMHKVKATKLFVPGAI